MKKPDLEQLRRHFRYEPNSGKLFWNDRPNSDFCASLKRTQEQVARMWRGKYLGKEALACVTEDGYAAGRYLGSFWRAHQVIWLLYNDELPEQIDHKDGDRLNNRLSNLRAASQAINSRNRRTPARTKSGVMGVRQVESGRWQALIGARPQRYLGTFDTKEQAAVAWTKARDELGYYPNHGR